MMQWERDSGGQVIRDWTPDTLAVRNEELAWAMRNARPWRMIDGRLVTGKNEQIAEDLRQEMQIGRSKWKGGMRDLALAGELTNLEGTYGGLVSYPLASALSAVTPSTTVETQLVTPAQGAVFLPIPANAILAPQVYRVVICGLTTTTVTASNLTWTFRAGNSATPASNVSLGASAAVAKTTTAITNGFWVVKGDFTVQSIGAPGANSKIVSCFDMKMQTTAAGSGYVSWLWGTGATPASFDASVAPNSSVNGGQIGLNVTSSVTVTDTFTIQQVHWMDWN